MVKIFTVSHGPQPYLTNKLYQTIYVNSKAHSNIGSSITDATGNNISNKNENFCELTASYWITQNCTDQEYVGLCHYRRYFNLFYNKLSISPSTQKRITAQNFKKTKLYTVPSETQQEHIVNILKNYDVILPRHSVSKHNKRPISLSENYKIFHRERDFNITKSVIAEKYPSYKTSIVEYLDNGNSFHAANMLIAPKKIWDDYHNWLFSILFEVEKRIEIPIDDYQKRVFGFISERLLGLYFYNNKLNIKEIPLYKIE
ncbi:DUF4422 domain-containing protein [Tamlana crocina]